MTALSLPDALIAVIAIPTALVGAVLAPDDDRMPPAGFLLVVLLLTALGLWIGTYWPFQLCIGFAMLAGYLVGRMPRKARA